MWSFVSSVTYCYVCVIFWKGNISLPLRSSFHKSVKSFPENRLLKWLTRSVCLITWSFTSVWNLLQMIGMIDTVHFKLTNRAHLPLNEGYCKGEKKIKYQKEDMGQIHETPKKRAQPHCSRSLLFSFKDHPKLQYTNQRAGNMTLWNFLWYIFLFYKLDN